MFNILFCALSCPGLAYVSGALRGEYYSVVSAMYCMMLPIFIRLNKKNFASLYWQSICEYVQVVSG